MTKVTGPKNVLEDDIVFADEEHDEPAVVEPRGAWKILIADDEEEVHNITTLVILFL